MASPLTAAPVTWPPVWWMTATTCDTGVSGVSASLTVPFVRTVPLTVPVSA